MSMNCSIFGLTPVQIDGLVATPAIVSYLVLPHSDEFIKRLPPERQRQAEGAREWIARVGPFERPLDIRKWWHRLHYLLTGEIGPVDGASGLLLTGGQELGEDMGFGPARLYGPAETKDFSRFLAAQNLANLQARMSFNDIGHLYPGTSEDLDDLRDNVGDLFVDLRRYVHKMSDRGNGLLVWLF